MSPITNMEMSRMGDRELWEATFRLVKEMNGTVRSHEADLYGDPAHGRKGLSQRVEELAASFDCLQDTLENFRSAVRVAWAAIVFVGGAVLTTLGLLLAEII